MSGLQQALQRHDYSVANIGYPSTQYPIETLAPMAIEAGLEQCAGAEKIHFVTHSMGGILLRYYLAQRPIEKLGRVVMLAPPNRGSEVVDHFKHIPGFNLINGPAGQQLGTDPLSIPMQLGAVGFELGVIAGNKSINPILSLVLPKPNDGKVSVASTQVQGMRDFYLAPSTHTFIMKNPRVIQLVIGFLQSGSFAQA